MTCLPIRPALPILLALASSTPAQPGIASISPSTQARSGRLLIQGSGFGAGQGSGAVRIDSLQAFVTTWTDTKIVAYVPEASRLGAVPVQVIAASGPSNAVSLTVTTRARAGRVLWRFQGDSLYSVTRAVLGADGTIFAVDVADTLYALSPEGALRWLVRGAGDKGVDVLPGGIVVTGSEDAIRGFHPADGSPLWTFVQSPRAFILLGPNAGPDGNLYAVATSGMGILSLTPGGQVRWTVPEQYNRPIVDYQEVVFGGNRNEDQLYFHANNHFRGVQLRNGNVRFTLGGGQSQPAVAPDQTIYAGGIARYDPDGNLLHSWVPSPNNGMTAAGVGPDGGVYFAYNLRFLTRRNPDLTERWTAISDGMVHPPIVDPRDRMIVGGGAFQFGMSGYLQAHATTDGTLLWRVELPQEIGNNLTSAARARFTPSGHTVFITVMMFGSNQTDVYWYLYALSTDGVWDDLGHGLAGSGGVPVLHATGDLAPGSPLTLHLSRARPATLAVIFLGLARLDAPLLGGTLVPRPDLPLYLTTDPAGSASLPLTWPAGAPSNLEVFYQAWALDPAAPQGVSASNALRSLSP